MNIETIYAAHKSSINNKYANTFAPLLYIIPLVLCLIPYAPYIAWIIPLYISFKEKDSDLIKYSGAQSSMIFFVGATANLIITLFAQLFAYPSTCVITAIINFTKNPTTAVFYIVVFFLCAAFALIAANYTKSYTVCKFKHLTSVSEKISAL